MSSPGGYVVGSGHGAGAGPGWAMVARAVSERVTPSEIDGIWVFAPMRREDREWGTAVISSRTDGERRRIFTGSYLLLVRGRERGQGKATVEEVGESPPDVLHDVIAGVQERAGEMEPPVPVAPTVWYTEDELASATISTVGDSGEHVAGDVDPHQEVDAGD